MRILAIAFLLAACARSQGQSTTPAFEWSGDTLFVRVVPTDSAGTYRGDTAVQRPAAIRYANGRYYITDVAEDQVIVLDTGLGVTRRIGLKGRGPGELYGASHIHIDGTRILVGEALNGRVSEFTAAGEFVQTYLSPFAAGAIAATSNATFSVARSPGHYAVRIVASGDPEPALRRPRVATSEAASRWNAMRGHDLVAADRSTVWVLDQASGAVCEYTDVRNTAGCRTLPASLDERLQSYRNTRVELLEQAIRMRVEAASLVKDMIIVGGKLVLLLPIPEMPIVIIDPVDGTLTPAMHRVTDTIPWLRSARSFTWYGKGFALIGDDGLGRVTLVSKDAPR